MKILILLSAFFILAACTNHKAKRKCMFNVCHNVCKQYADGKIKLYQGHYNRDFLTSCGCIINNEYRSIYVQRKIFDVCKENIDDSDSL